MSHVLKSVYCASFIISLLLLSTSARAQTCIAEIGKEDYLDSRSVVCEQVDARLDLIERVQGLDGKDKKLAALAKTLNMIDHDQPDVTPDRHGSALLEPFLDNRGLRNFVRGLAIKRAFTPQLIYRWCNWSRDNPRENFADALSTPEGRQFSEIEDAIRCGFSG